MNKLKITGGSLIVVCIDIDSTNNLNKVSNFHNNGVNKVEGLGCFLTSSLNIVDII